MTFYYKTVDDSIVRSDVEIKEDRFIAISESEYLSEKEALAKKKEEAMANFSSAAASAKKEKADILVKLGLTAEEADKVLSI